MSVTAPTRADAVDLDELARHFAGSLPLPGVSVEMVPATALMRSVAAEAVVATFVGSSTVEFALVVADTEALVGGADTAGLPIDALVRPAFDAAAATLGAGVLSDPRAGDARAVLEHGRVFALTTDTAALGWLVLAESGGAPALTATDRHARLGRLNNVAMTLTVEIGRTTMPVRSVLALEPGSVIELDRSAGAPADVLLNGRRIALGEIVVVDQDYAVRITQILDAADGAE